MPKIELDYGKCIKCGNCVQTCPVEVYEYDDGNIKLVKVELCFACRACETQCPMKAIKIEI
ncbi:MAG: 4Fe-4S binding protein [Candidatus Methanomethylicia archaeon]|nr:4Fe-4S binding protein [Candidatus Methanomethylicia archaeon]